MKVKLLSPVNHDGVIYEPGAEIEVGADAGAALVACGSAQEVETPKASKKAKEVEVL